MYNDIIMGTHYLYPNWNYDWQTHPHQIPISVSNEQPSSRREQPTISSPGVLGAEILSANMTPGGIGATVGVDMGLFNGAMNDIMPAVATAGSLTSVLGMLSWGNSSGAPGQMNTSINAVLNN